MKHAYESLVAHLNEVAAELSFPASHTSDLLDAITAATQNSNAENAPVYFNAGTHKYAAVPVIAETLRRCGIFHIALASATRSDQSSALSHYASVSHALHPHTPKIFTTRNWKRAHTIPTSAPEIYAFTRAETTGPDTSLIDFLSGLEQCAIIIIDQPSDDKHTVWERALTAAIDPVFTIGVTTADNRNSIVRTLPNVLTFPQLSTTVDAPFTDIASIDPSFVRDCAITLFTRPNDAGIPLEESFVQGRLAQYLAGKTQVPRTAAAVRACAELARVFISHTQVVSWNKPTYLEAKARLDIILRTAVIDAYNSAEVAYTVRPVTISQRAHNTHAMELPDVESEFIPEAFYRTGNKAYCDSAAFTHWGHAQLSRALNNDSSVTLWARIDPDLDSQVYAQTAQSKRHVPDFIAVDKDNTRWTINVVADNEYGAEETWHADEALRYAYAEAEASPEFSHRWRHITVACSIITPNTTLQHLKDVSGVSL